MADTAKNMQEPDSFETGLAFLEPRLRHALAHPLRREIVRALIESRRPRRIDELAAALAPASVAAVSYHVQVLHRGDVIEGQDADSATGGGHRTYGSLVAGDAEVLAVLEATREWDLDRGEKVAGHSSGFLRMFRIPRPARLGSHRKHCSEPEA